MKPKLIVMSHGHMAEEAVKSAQMIVGEIEDIHVVSMEPEDGLEGTNTKFTEVMNKIGGESVIVLVDLFGGTPFNVVNIASENYANVRVLSGLNLGMIIEYSVSQEEDIDKLVSYLAQTGKDAIQSIPVEDDEDDFEIDG